MHAMATFALRLVKRTRLTVGPVAVTVTTGARCRRPYRPARGVALPLRHLLGLLGHSPAPPPSSSSRLFKIPVQGPLIWVVLRHRASDSS